MFLECNDVQILLVNLEDIPSNVQLDVLQCIGDIPCVFIYTDQIQISELQEHSNDSSTFVNYKLGLTIDMFLNEVLSERNMFPFQAVYLTGNVDDIHPTIQAGISTILFSSREVHVSHTELPDFVVYDVKGLTRCLNGSAYGYYGEMIAQGAYGTGFFKHFELDHKLHPDVKAFCFTTGRYFTVSDRRAPIHALSQKILQLKRGKSVEHMGALLASTIEVLSKHNKIDLITAVPPRPGESSRHIPVLNAAALDFPKTIDRSIIDIELLRTVRDYPPQKYAGGFIQRFMNVADAFEATREVSGNVVIFDDVLTSGATALECARMLYEAGADAVAIVSFAVSQSKVEPAQIYQMDCKGESCDGHYVMRFNGQDGSAFFGCTNYPRCRSNMTYELGRQEYNSNVTLAEPDSWTSWF